MEETNQNVSEELQETETKDEAKYSQVDVDKIIQSETDKVRTKYSKEIKELQGRIAELMPEQKSDHELEIEKRLAELEKAQKEVEQKKVLLELQDMLQGKGIDKRITSFLKSDIDINSFIELFNGAVTEKMKNRGYIPSEHVKNDRITQEEFKNMSYSQRAELYEKNPSLYEKLKKR